MRNPKNLIELVNNKGEFMVTLDKDGKITWKDGCDEKQFRDIVVYLFDIVYRQQASLFQSQQRILELLEEKPDPKKIILLPH